MTRPAHHGSRRYRPGQLVGRFDVRIRELCRIFDPSFSLRGRKERAKFLRQVAEDFRDNKLVLSRAEWNRLDTVLDAMGFFTGIPLPEGVTPQHTLLLGDALPSMRRLLASRTDRIISCISSSRPTANIDGTPADIEELVAKFAHTRWFQWANGPISGRPLDTEYGLSSLAALASGGDYDLDDAFPGRTTDWENPAEFYTVLYGAETARTFTSYQMSEIAPTIGQQFEYFLKLIHGGYIRLESGDTLAIVADPVIAFRVGWESRQVARALPQCRVHVFAPSVERPRREVSFRAVEEVAYLLIAAS